STPGRAPSPPKPARTSPDSTRSSSPVRASAPLIRPSADDPPAKLQPQAQGATQSAEAFPQTGAGASPSPARSAESVELSSQPGPATHTTGDLYEPTPQPPAKTESANVVASSERSPVDKIKGALETKRKMMVVMALDKGTITI